MTAETDLLPLPEKDDDLPRSGMWNGEWRAGADPCWLQESVEAYARACVEANTKHYRDMLCQSQDDVMKLRAEIESLRNLCGMAYQLAGVHDAPEAWLDALSNAAIGVPFETEGLLPYMPESVASTESLRVDGEPVVRFNDDGTLDEVAGRGDFHLEQMGHDHWWMQLGPHMVNLSARGKIRVHFGRNEAAIDTARAADGGA